MNTDIRENFASRIRYLRDLWRRLGTRATQQNKPICILGAGQHTRLLLDVVAEVSDGPPVACILDDDPPEDPTINGIFVHRPEDVNPSDFSAILISSDTIEEQLARRVVTWLECVSAALRPEVVRPYEGLPTGPYAQWTSEVGGMDMDHIVLAPHQSIVRVPGVAPVQDVVRAARDDTTDTRAAACPVPVPGDDIRRGVAMTAEQYVRTGRTVNHTVRRLFAEHDPRNRQVSDLAQILDWGCGTGRVMSHFTDLAESGVDVWGCDPSAASINWMKANLAPTFRVFLSLFRPPLPLAENSFDLVYGFSVFTHISDLVDPWLMELRRVTRPNGTVIVTVHDEHAWEACRQDSSLFLAKSCPEIDFSEPMSDDFVSRGRGPTAKTFWHSDGIRRRWSDAFEIVAIHPTVFGRTQSAVVMRPRG